MIRREVKLSLLLILSLFQTDWNDGLAAAALSKAKGAAVPGFREMDNRPQNWVSNLDVALTGAKKLGINPIMDSRLAK